MTTNQNKTFKKEKVKKKKEKKRWKRATSPRAACIWCPNEHRCKSLPLQRKVGQTQGVPAPPPPPPGPHPRAPPGWLRLCLVSSAVWLPEPNSVSSLFFSQVFIPNKYLAPQTQSQCLLLDNPVCSGWWKGLDKGKGITGPAIAAGHL